MRPIDAEPSEGRVKLHSAIHGGGAYDAFKRIASEFYTNHTYKFVALTLDGEPRPDIVTFTAEFWRVPDGKKDPPPNDPLTLEELREMDGDKVSIHYIDGFYTDEDGAYFGKFEQLVRECNGRLTACELPLKYYGKTWLAYRRKPEEG